MAALFRSHAPIQLVSRRVSRIAPLRGTCHKTILDQQALSFLPTQGDKYIWQEQELNPGPLAPHATT